VRHDPLDSIHDIVLVEGIHAHVFLEFLLQVSP
jgi:hypothetical protein